MHLAEPLAASLDHSEERADQLALNDQFLNRSLLVKVEIYHLSDLYDNLWRQLSLLHEFLNG